MYISYNILDNIFSILYIINNEDNMKLYLHIIFHILIKYNYKFIYDFTKIFLIFFYIMLFIFFIGFLYYNEEDNIFYYKNKNYRTKYLHDNLIKIECLTNINNKISNIEKKFNKIKSFNKFIGKKNITNYSDNNIIIDYFTYVICSIQLYHIYSYNKLSNIVILYKINFHYDKYELKSLLNEIKNNLDIRYNIEIIFYTI